MSWLIKETLFLIKNFFDLQGIKKADLFAGQGAQSLYLLCYRTSRKMLRGLTKYSQTL